MYWNNQCKHDPTEYVGSFSVNEETVQKVYDLWVIHDHGQCLCIRYGNDPDAYISSMSIDNILMHTAHLEPYASAIKLLKEAGQFRWFANKPPTAG